MNNQYIIPAAILALAIVVAACLGSYVAIRAQGEGSVISATGSAKVSVVSDHALWRLSVSRRVVESEVGRAYGLVSKDVATVTAYLTAAGLATSSIESMPTQAYEQYSSNPGPREYIVSAEIKVHADDPRLIERLAKDVTNLAANGITFASNTVEYTYTGLAKTRVDLLGDAIKDARARAVEIAEAGDSSVGALKSAQSGVVQVLAPNSIDVSDYGSYDTQSIEKEVMVTARATFYVR